MRHYLALSCLSLFLFMLPAKAQDLELLGRWTEGASAAVAATGTTVFYNEGADLVRADASGAGVPVEEGRVTVPGFIRDLAVADGRLYATMDDGVHFFDIARPGAPRALGSFAIAYPGGVRAQGDRVFAWSLGEVVWLDVSDPAQPELLSRFDPPGIIEDAALTDTHAFLAIPKSGLIVLRLADGLRTPVSHPGAVSVELADSVAYVTTTQFRQPAMMTLFDVSEPEQLRALSSRELGVGRWMLTKAGDRIVAYGDGPRERMPEVTDVAHVFDVSDPRAPRAVAEATVNATWGANVLSGLRLAAGDDVVVWHQANRLQGARLGAEANWELVLPAYHAYDVAWAGDVALVANGPMGVHWLDMSSPDAPKRLGTSSLPEAFAFDSVHRVLVAGDHAYLGGLFTVHVVQLNAGSRPSGVTVSVDLREEASSLLALDYALGASVLYVARNDGALGTVDISDPSRPVALPDVPLTGQPYGQSVAAEGETVVVSTSASVHVFDASDPRAPREVSHLQLPLEPPYFSGVALRGGVAYVADAMNGLYVIDVSHPAAPVVVGHVETPYASSPRLEVVGDRLLLAGGAHLSVFDLTDPHAPRRLDVDVPLVGTSVPAVAVAASGAHLLVAHGFVGASLYRHPFTATHRSVAEVPQALRLEGAYPNPVHRDATIRYHLREARAVRLVVYDVLGRPVARLVDAVQPPGAHQTTFDAEGLGLPAGTYVYRLETGGQTATRRLVVVR